MSIIHASSRSYSPPEFNIIKAVKSDIPLVLVTRVDDFVFNEELLNISGDYCLFDLCEYEWNKSDFSDTHIFGKNTNDFIYRFPGDEWLKLDNWMKEHPPRIYFKRELLKKDVTDKVVSLTYPSYQPSYPIQTKEQFDARPIELNHYFGRSHEDRIKFQGKAYLYASDNGITIIDNLYYLQGFLNEGTHKRIWVNVHVPHFARTDLGNLLQLNNLSKFSLSMPGCGIRCFRDSEAPMNSIMVLQDNEIAFPFEWIHGVNCIRYKGSNPIDAIEKALQREDLYDIYLKGMEDIEKYRIENYATYIEKLIKPDL